MILFLLLALCLGIRHAIEPDHLAAMSTLITEQPRSADPLHLGACWGFGHMLAILALGGALFVLLSALPGHVSDLRSSASP